MTEAERSKMEKEKLKAVKRNKKRKKIKQQKKTDVSRTSVQYGNSYVNDFMNKYGGGSAASDTSFGFTRDKDGKIVVDPPSIPTESTLVRHIASQGNTGRTDEELARVQSNVEMSRMTNQKWKEAAEEVLWEKTSGMGFGALYDPDSQKAGEGFDFASASQQGQMANNANVLIQNWDNIPEENKVDSVKYLISVYGINDQTKDIILNTYNNASTEERLSILDDAVFYLGKEDPNVKYMQGLVAADPNAKQIADERILNSFYEDVTYTDEDGNEVNTKRYTGAPAVEHMLRQNALRDLQEQRFIDEYVGNGYYTKVDAVADTVNNAVSSWWANLYDAAAIGFVDMLRKGQEGIEFSNPFDQSEADGVGSYIAGFVTDHLSNLFTYFGMPVSLLSKAFLTPEDVAKIEDSLLGVTDFVHEGVAYNERFIEATDMNAVERFGLEVLGGTIEMVPGIVAGIFSSGVGLATFGTGAAGANARSAYENGATLEESVRFGLVTGVAEVVIEKMFMGFGFMGKGFIAPALKKIIPEGSVLTSTTRRILDESGFTNSISARILKGVVASGGEATEEMVMEIVTPYLERTTYDPEAMNATWKEVLYAGGLGAAIGGILGIPVMVSSIANEANKNKTYDEIIDSFRQEKFSEIDELVNANEITPEQAASLKAETEDILSGKGSLNVSDSQEEVKVTGEALDTVYDSYEEAKKAMMQEARTKKDGEKITANYIDNGVVKTFSTTAKGGTLGLGRSTEAGKEYQRIAQAKNATERSGYQLNVKEEIIKEVSALSKAIGREVEFYRNEDPTDHGYMDKKTGKIYINAGSNQSAARSVIAHELTHQMENTAGWSKLVELMKKHYGSSYESRRQERIDAYEAFGKPLKVDETRKTYDEADQELVAMFVEEKLLTDADTIREVVNTDKTLAQKIIAWINKVIQKLAGNKEQKMLVEARDLWNQALQEEQSGNKKAPKEGAGERHSFGGVNARTADLKALENAKDMLAKNHSAVDIFRETGWFVGADGKWRFEIDDSNMSYHKDGKKGNPDQERQKELYAKMFDGSITQEEMQELSFLEKNGVKKQHQLEDYIDHQALFEAYPELRTVELQFRADMESNEKGSYSPDKNIITISSKLKNAPEETLVHEIQHAIQKIENFSGGSSAFGWAVKDADGNITKRFADEYAELRKGLSKEDSNRYARYEDLSFAMDQMLYSPDAMDDARYERYEKESDDLYSELYHKPWFLRLKDLKRLMENDGYRYRYLYTNSAGEIEARDAASRRKMTAEERRNRMPDTGDENTVFPEDATKNRAPEVEAQDRRYSISPQFKKDIRQIKKNIKNKKPNSFFTDSHLMIGDTPEFLQQFGFDISKPLLMTSGHAKDILMPKDPNNTQYHGLTAENLINALSEINDPVLVISSVSFNKKEDGTLMILTSELDANNIPIGIYVYPVGKGNYNRIEISANFVKTAYGRDNTTFFIEQAVKENRLLYENKRKSQQLRYTPGVYFPSNIPTVDFKKSITRYKDIVNKSHDNTRKSIGSDSAYLDAVNRGDMGTAQRLIREAANIAGFTSPKLYHGTNWFGFTQLRTSDLEGFDWSPFFATNDDRIAETYSGKTGLRRISDRNVVDADSVSDKELIGLVKEHIDSEYMLASKEDRVNAIKSFHNGFRAIYNDAGEIARKTGLLRRKPVEFRAAVNAVKAGVQKMMQAETSEELDSAYKVYEIAVDELETNHRMNAKDMDLIHPGFVDSDVRELKRLLDNEVLYVRYIDDFAEEFLTPSEARYKLYNQSGIYELYANTENLFEIDAEGVNWNKIPGEHIGQDGNVNTRAVAEYAREEGYAGVLIRNLVDSGGRMGYVGSADIYIFFEPASQVKSADTVTYDDNNEVIPLSERFNEENNDIRWSVGKGNENRKMREEDLKTIKKMEKIVKKAENQRDFANQEKEELKAKQKEKEKKYKAELYRRRKETDAERKAQKKSLAAIAKEYEKGNTKKARNLVTEEQKRIDAMYPKTDKELRKERADAIVKEYFKQKEKPDPNSTESTWLKNKSVRNIVDQFRRETIEQLVYVGRFTVTNDNVILDENQQEVAVRKDDTWDFSEVKNTYTPYFGMTLLAKQEGIDVDRFFTMFAKIRDMQRRPKNDFKTRSRKEEVVAYINSLNLTKKQKEFLYYDAARYAKSKMPIFLDGGNVTEEKGNIRGRMMEALDNISFDMFNGHMKEDSRWAKEDSAQIRQEDINNFVEMLFGKEDSEAKDLFLDRFTRMIVDYSEQMEEARLLRASNLLVNKPQQSDPLKMRVVRAYREAKQNFLCEGEAFERMADKMKNPLIRARYYQAKSAVAIANEMINGKHQRNLDGDLMGKSLYQIFEPIFKADTKAKNSNGIELLTELVNNRHDIYRQKNGKGYTGNTIEECETIVENISMAHPEILKVADELVEYGRNLLRMCVDCGRLSKEDFDYFVAKYPYYVPAYRIEENEIMDRSGKVRRDTAVIKTAKFGNRDVLPLWDQMVRRTNETIKSCKKNQLAYELVKATRNKGYEDFISSVTKTVDQGNNETAAAELGQVEDIGKARRTQEDDTFIPWYCNGEKFDVDIADASLLYGWDRINYRLDEKQYHRVLRKMNSFRRAVLTQYNPTFWLTNHIRDLSDMFLYNQHAQNLTGYMVEAYGEMFGGKIGGTKAFQKAYKKATGKEYVYDEEKRADALERYLSKGASQASIFEYDNTNAGRKTTKGKVKSAMKKPLEAFDAWNFMFEQIPRLAVFNETIDRLTEERDKGKNEYTDEEIESIAAYQAADATLNFGRSGTVVKNLNTYGCTFLNAGVQGMDRARRMFTQIKDGDKKTVMLNLCGLVFKIFAMGYSVHIVLDWIYGGDDEYANAIREFLYGDDEEEIMQEWKEMSDYNKMNYLVININGAWIRIPQGRLSAFLYSFGYNGEKVFDGEMDALDLVEAQWDMAKETVLFGNPLTNNILGPVVEAWRNKDNWGNDIVSEYEDMGEGFHYLEYDDETSMAARKAAEFGHWLTADLFGVEGSRILDFSPKKLDYVMKQYFGSYANLLMPFLDGGTGLKDKVTEGLAETLFKKFYINPVENNRLAGDYYDMKEEFENTAKAHDNDSPYAVAVKVFDDYNELLKPLREQITAISDDPNLTAEEKAEQILALREEMNQIYRDAVADAMDALGYAHANYYGKDGNSDLYEDWQRLTKGSDWVVSTMSDTAQAQFAEVSKTGVDAENFVSTYDFVKNATADKDENGKSINGSKKEKIVNYINSLDLTVEQKMSLYTNVAGYKVSDRSPAPDFVNGALVQPSTTNMASPLSGGGELTSGYGWRNCPIHGREFHAAVDISAESGTDVGAVISGTVTMATVHGGYGNSIEITSTDENGNTVVTKYNHLLNMGVEVGDVINQGTKIGEVGSTGDSIGPHLDFRLKINNDWVDPTQYIDLEASGIVNASGYTQKEGSGGTSSGGGSSGGGSSGGSSRSGSTASVGSRTSQVASNRRSGGLTLPSVGGSGGNGGGSRASTPVAGMSTSSPTYGNRGLYLPKASDYTPNRRSISSSVATTQRTGRTGGSFWDDNILA